MQATTKQLDARVHELDALKVPHSRIVSAASTLAYLLTFRLSSLQAEMVTQ